MWQVFDSVETVEALVLGHVMNFRVLPCDTVGLCELVTRIYILMCGLEFAMLSRLYGDNSWDEVRRVDKVNSFLLATRDDMETIIE